MIRRPAVSGQFYRGSARALRAQVGSFIVPAERKVAALGILSPHAGLIYSGAVAGAVYSRIELPGTFVLIGPNHTGRGAPVSIMRQGSWETPLGSVEIDEPLAAAILKGSPHFREDTLAHLHEHSLEVQLPFIQYFTPAAKIVPIQMLDVRLETCTELGRVLADAVRDRSAKTAAGARAGGVLIVASSDMTHYEQADAARTKDAKAIQQMLALDPEGLYRTVRDLGITMCGFGPAVAMLTACRLLGATSAELVKYAHSGETSGDFDQVVGYAGIVVV